MNGETNGNKIKSKILKDQMSDPKSKCQRSSLETSLGTGVSRKEPMREWCMA